MKLFIVYISIPKGIYYDRLKYLIDNSTVKARINYEEIDPYMVCGIYAWTTKESLLQAFIATRPNKIYTVKKVTNLDKSEIKKFKESYYDFELGNFRYWYNQNNDVPFPAGETYKDPDSLFIDIVSTRNEHDNSSTFLQENMNEHFVIPDLYVDYNIFKPELKDALDVLGYTYIYDLYLSGDADRVNCADYNKSFSLTPGGNPFIDVRNEYMGFVYLYHYPLFGDDDVYNEDE